MKNIAHNILSDSNGVTAQESQAQASHAPSVACGQLLINSKNTQYRGSREGEVGNPKRSGFLRNMTSRNHTKVKKRNDAEVLKEVHEQVIAEKQKELDKIMELLAATNYALEQEKHARAKEQAEMVGKDIDPTVGKISDVTEMTGVVRIEQLQLNNGRKANLNAYVHDVLFSQVKFLSDESFAASPKILEEAMETMGIVEEWDKLQHSEDTKKEIRIALTHRRSYIKGQVFKKYKGM